MQFVTTEFVVRLTIIPGIGENLIKMNVLINLCHNLMQVNKIHAWSSCDVATCNQMRLYLTGYRKLWPTATIKRFTSPAMNKMLTGVSCL